LGLLFFVFVMEEGEVSMMVVVFFFFKQKTAYEITRRDWSSDVCSSDLGHLGLFGYDPLEYRIGRGVLEALGINFAIGSKDVAARGNFCTVDSHGLITDRRAGRPTTERCVAMCRLMQQIEVPGVEVFVEPVREHRFVVVFRGEGLGDKVNDTDPQAVG